MNVGIFTTKMLYTKPKQVMFSKEARNISKNRGNPAVAGLDSRFRGNDKMIQLPIIPAKAGIQKCGIESSFP